MSSPPSNLDHLRHRATQVQVRPARVRVGAQARVGAPLVAVLLATSAGPALAQEPPPNCPPGSWFCADAEKPAPKAQPGTPAPTVTVTKGGDKAELEPLPPADAPPAPPPPPPPPPSVVYRPGPPP